MKMKFELYTFSKHLVEDSQLIRYARAYAQYCFLDRAQLLIQKLLDQGYVGSRRKYSLNELSGRHHEHRYRYEISNSQMA